jgi:hypothetical protein
LDIYVRILFIRRRRIIICQIAAYSSVGIRDCPIIQPIPEAYHLTTIRTIPYDEYLASVLSSTEIEMSIFLYSSSTFRHRHSNRRSFSLKVSGNLSLDEIIQVSLPLLSVLFSLLHGSYYLSQYPVRFSRLIASMRIDPAVQSPSSPHIVTMCFCLGITLKFPCSHPPQDGNCHSPS